MNATLANLLNNNPKLMALKKKAESLPKLDLENDSEFIADGLKAQLIEDTLLAMKEDGVTQQMLADRIGVKRQYISRILNETANFTLETIAALAVALNRIPTVKLAHKVNYTSQEFKTLSFSDAITQTNAFEKYKTQTLCTADIVKELVA